MADVTVNPTLPLGSESLKLGPTRIRAIAAALLQVLGFDGTTEQQFVAPFTSLDATGLLTVTGDAVAPLGIATLQQLGQRTIFASLSSADNQLYMGTTDPTFNSYEQNAIYLLYNGAPPNAANVSIQLNAAPAVSLLHADGTQFAVGTFFADTIYIAAYDGSALRAIDFVGGNLTKALILAADPTTALGAATRQYVDSGIITPVKTIMPAGFALNGVAQPAIVYTVTTPDDGHHYVIHAGYNLNIAIFNAQNNANGALPAACYLTDGTVQWGSCGHTVVGPAAASEAHPILASAGFAPTIYAPNTSVTITLEAIGNTTSDAWAVIDNTAGAVPQSSLIVTLMRSTAV